MLNIFIAGTGTEVGKTTVASALGAGLVKKGMQVGYWKPVSSGLPSDIEVVREHASQVTVFPPCFAYDTPVSPHVAAEREKKTAANLQTLDIRLGELQRNEEIDVLLIEAAGGLLVPLNSDLQSWMDFLAYHPEFSILLVAASGLGTINHTSLSVRCLQYSGFEVRAIVMSGEKFFDNEQVVRRMDRNIPVASFELCPQLSHNPIWLERCQELATFVNNSLAAGEEELVWQHWDQTDVWHPFTQHQTAPPNRAVIKAIGVWLETTDGHKMIDGIGSWWTNSVGHGREIIAQNCATQIRKCDHVVFAGLTHEPAARLAHDIISLTSGNFDRVFFSDNGSTAVEIAAKIVFQYQQNLGQGQKDTFVSFYGGYHGDTIGTMSLGDYHKGFTPLMFKTLRARPVTVHPSRVCPGGIDDFRQNIEELRQLLADNADQICAIIIEPLVQGAAGMLVQDEKWLREVGELASAHDIPLIFDEVFTGLGRTGHYFAFQRAQVVPDILCLAKGLTGGVLPLALTLTKEKFFRSFLAPERSKAFMHGHTFTANPVACRAALTALAILQKEKLAAKALTLETCFRDWVTQNKDMISNPRVLGAILAFEPKKGPAVEVTQRATAHGLFLRPLGDTVYFVPPLVIDESELALAFQALEKALRENSK